MTVPIFAIRFSPWAAALAGFFLLEGQWEWPHAYPWPLLVALVAVLISAVMIAWKRVPWLEYPFVVAWERAMNHWQRPIIFNLGDWGLAGEELSERVIR